MKSTYAIALIVILLGLPFQATTLFQTTVTLESLVIEIWPEYDRPEALVIYRGVVDEAISLPAALSFQLPDYVQELNAVAVLSDQNRLVNNAYTTEQAEGGLLLTFTVNNRNFQFEYYDPVLIAQDGPERRFTYEADIDYAVSYLFVDIQQPTGATPLQFATPPSETLTRDDQLTYYSFQQEDVAAGSPISLAAQYRNETNTLTADPGLTLLPITTPELPADTASVWPIPTVYVIVGLGLAIFLLSGGLWYLYKPAQMVTEPASPPGEGSPYCHQCGAAYKSDALFCHRCGTVRP